ncbi:MAG: HEAT repeat domain-containing protein [Gemmataceae bacterium]
MSGAACLLLLAVSGCHSLWLDTQEYWSDTVQKPDPVEVVQTTKRGDRRAKYLGLIQEPIENGGTQAEQDEAFLVLLNGATKDPAATCRLAAIDSLGKFKDPRAVRALETAYDTAYTFEPRIAAIIRQQALEGLGRTGNPAAIDRLVRVARSHAAQKSLFDQQQTNIERLAAVRALSKFGNRPEVVQTLVHVMKTQKDVAVKNRCHASLQVVTGVRTPKNATEWERVVGNGGQNFAPVPGEAVPTQDRAIAGNPSINPFQDMIRRVTGYEN